MFDRVKALQVAGNGIRAIIHETGFNWRTVAKWVRLDDLRGAQRHGSKVDDAEQIPDLSVAALGGGMHHGPGFAAGDQISRLYRCRVVSNAATRK
jgi:hypothetical protein